jgi:hypothetical protein
MHIYGPVAKLDIGSTDANTLSASTIRILLSECYSHEVYWSVLDRDRLDLDAMRWGLGSEPGNGDCVWTGSLSNEAHRQPAPCRP